MKPKKVALAYTFSLGKPRPEHAVICPRSQIVQEIRAVSALNRCLHALGQTFCRPVYRPNPVRTRAHAQSQYIHAGRGNNNLQLKKDSPRTAQIALAAVSLLSHPALKEPVCNTFRFRFNFPNLQVVCIMNRYM